MKKLFGALIVSMSLFGLSACSSDSGGGDCAFCAQAEMLCMDGEVSDCKCGRVPAEANSCAETATDCNGVITCALGGS